MILTLTPNPSQRAENTKILLRTSVKNRFTSLSWAAYFASEPSLELR